MKKILAIVFILVSTLSFAGNNLEFGVKSGKIIMNTTTTVAGQSIKSNQTTLFREYGKKTSIRTVGEVGIGPIVQGIDRTIIINGEGLLSLDNIKKTYSTLSEGDYEKYEQYLGASSGDVIGKEEVLGKMCDVILYKDGEVSIKQWLWKGIPLKLISSGSYGMTIESVATDIDIKNIGKNSFEIPQGYSKYEPSDSLSIDSFNLTEDDMKKVKNALGNLKSLFE